ncbi:MAG TPA: sulfatase-like hydrolase/transferase [Vicinamibacterales bacterium]|nr:sulfatase-like hydrolase/transferase [Vicinamibacterales bacterium]
MILLLLATAAACTSASPPVPPFTPPHVLLITIDTLRADRVASEGPFAELTPNLRALAARGVRFTDATAHAPLTFPSHVSIHTGLLPSEHGARDNGSYVLEDSARTMAERLRDRGYTTGAFVASFVLSRSFGLAQGFEEYVDRFDPSGSRYTFAELQRRGSEVAGDAAAWLVRVRAERRPIFLWLHLYDPHAPYDAPAAFASRWPDQPYNAEVAASDWAVGYLLQEAGDEFLENTLVVVTSDHGESLGEHGEPEHGIFLYDATMKVPLIIAGPGFPTGAIVTEQVRHIDLLPTVLELVAGRREAVDAQLSGESLVPLLKGERRDKVPPSYSESWYQQLHFGWSELRAVRTGDWKYIAAPRRELYDLTSDAGELTDVSGARGNVAGGLQAEVDRLGKPAAAGVASERPVDSATAERLQSLGYVGGGPGAAGSSGHGDDPKDRMPDYVRFVGQFYEALDHLERGAFEGATRGFRALAREFPFSFEAHQFLGRSLAASGRRAEALEEYELAIGLNPRFAAIHFDAARVEAALGRFPAARDRVRAGLELEPDSFYGHFVSGLVEQAAGNPAGALAGFERAVALNEGMAPAHFELGALAESAGNRDDALRHYRRAAESDVTFQAARAAVERLSPVAPRKSPGRPR